MKLLIHRSLIAVVALLAGSASGGDLEAYQQDQRTEYRVTNLPSLGGTSSGGNSINDVGWAAGFSNLPGNEATHATLWPPYASKLDLGTLGGPNSNVAWPVKNNRGLISGIAETARMDPLGEAWSCSAFFPTRTGHVCRGFVWERGVMRPLPTLGGTHSFATGANNRGQVVGWAENTVADPTCNPPQVLQFRAVIWGPGRDQIQPLPPLDGDTAGAATAINDKGQVVGISGICDNAVGRFTAAHAVLWEKGSVTDLGSLGGVAWNTPMAINERGDVVGFSNLPGGDPGGFNAHAFLKIAGGSIQDLHPRKFPEDVFSQALGINNRRQVVGLSCTAGFASCRAFLWEDGVITDLNTLAPGYRDHLFYAGDINDRGRITGLALRRDGGGSSAFVAIPAGRHGRDGGEAASAAAQASGHPTSEVILPENVRQDTSAAAGPRPRRAGSIGHR